MKICKNWGLNLTAGEKCIHAIILLLKEICLQLKAKMPVLKSWLNLNGGIVRRASLVHRPCTRRNSSSFLPHGLGKRLPMYISKVHHKVL